jgi:endo-1,4-beta-xylanase
MTKSIDRDSLKEVFRDDFLIGAALSADQINGRDPDAMTLVQKHCNSITPENVLKWEEVHPERDRYNFDTPDRYVALGEANRMHIIGHTLVWHYQTPNWVFQDASGKTPSREALLDRMKDHIFTVMGRYRGRIHGWDVVNEAVVADGSFRKSGWFNVIGEEYVRKAFEFAREADPDAELYYNEYDYEYRPKLDAVIRLVRSLQAKGARVDVGVVPFCHLDSPVTDLASYDEETRKKLDPFPNGSTDAVLKIQAKRYADLFSLFRKHRDKFSRITFWGVHDSQSWRSYLPIRGRTEYPLLFDRQCRPKPALDAILQTAQVKG